MLKLNRSAGTNLFLVVFGSIFTTLLLLGLGAFGFWFFQNKANLKVKVAPTPTAVLSPTMAPTLEATEEVLLTPTPIPAETQLKLLFANKFADKPKNIVITISENDGRHIKGGVKQMGTVGGGWFLSYQKDNGKWMIVDDGNGTVSCAKIKPFNFSSSMVPECWDNVNNRLVTR